MFGRRNTRDGRPPDSRKPRRRALNMYAFATAMLSSATPLFLGYDLAAVYRTAVTVAKADLKLLACVIAASSLLGAAASVGVRRLVGDRRAVLLSVAALCAGALARGLMAGVYVFVDGVGMGLAVMTVPAYAAEISPVTVRGSVLASHPDGLLYLGCILGSLTGGVLKLPPHAPWPWRLAVASSASFPALLSSAIVLLMPETPRWLVAKDRVSDARRVLARTSATLEEAELRLLDIQDELGVAHVYEPVTTAAKGSRWTEDRWTIWRELLARPTEPLHRAVITVLVTKIFQQASGTGGSSLVQYVQTAFRYDVVGVSSTAQTMAAFGFVVVLSLSVSLVLVELGWQLVRTLAAGGCRLLRLAPSSSHNKSYRGVGLTRRQEQLKWARGLSATMLLSLMALAWIALGPAQWADA